MAKPLLQARRTRRLICRCCFHTLVQPVHRLLTRLWRRSAAKHFWGGHNSLDLVVPPELTYTENPYYILQASHRQHPDLLALCVEAAFGTMVTLSLNLLQLDIAICISMYRLLCICIHPYHSQTCTRFLWCIPSNLCTIFFCPVSAYATYYIYYIYSAILGCYTNILHCSFLYIHIQYVRYLYALLPNCVGTKCNKLYSLATHWLTTTFFWAL